MKHKNLGFAAAFCRRFLLLLFAFGCHSFIMAQGNKEIKGKITDSKGSPLSFVNVVVKGSKIGALSTENGTYSVSVPSDTQNPTLVFSMIGYNPIEEVVSKRTVINVILQEETNTLEQIVVVGYGTQKKTNLTGAVTSVDVGKALGDRPISDIGRGLQGVVPGLMVTSATGDIGQDPIFRLRGSQGSLNAPNGSSPLILLDNVEIPSLQMINPNDIESISILKDASSSAIYGTRAAFGVILLTSKSGKAGRPKVTYSNNFAFRTPTYMPEIAPAPEGAEMAMAIARRNNSSVSSFGAVGYKIDDLAIQKMYEWREQWGGKNLSDEMIEDVDYEIRDGQLFFYREWDALDRYFKKWTPQQTHDVSVIGGSDQLSYNLSLGHLNEEGAMKVNADKFRRNTVNLGVNSKISNLLSIRGKTLVTKTQLKTPFSFGSATYDPLYYLTRWPSFFPYGTIDGKPFRSAVTEVQNSQMVVTEATSYRVALGGTLTFLKGLTLDIDYIYANTNTNKKETGGSITAWDFWNGLVDGGIPYRKYTDPKFDYVSYYTKYTEQNTGKAILTYDTKYGDHNIKLMAGMDIEEWVGREHASKRMNLISDSKAELTLASGDQFVSGNTLSPWSTLGYFGRINYDYKGKYILQLAARYDGSSRFPSSGRWALFPSASFGWRLSEEEFMTWSKLVFSNIKPRVSWGMLGNDAVGTNVFIPTMSSEESTWVQDGKKVVIVNPPKNVKPSLTWEKILDINYGMDLGLFKNSLNLTFDLYKRITSDMLSGGVTMPSTLGVAPSLQNYGELTAKGWELQIDYTYTFRNGLSVNAMFNISDVVEKLTKYNNKTRLVSGNYEGKVLGEVWGYQTDRFFTAGDFNDLGTPNQKIKDAIPSQKLFETGTFMYGPGDIKYVDSDGNGVIDYGDNTVENHGDKMVIGNTNRRYTFGFRLGASWKGFDFSALFQGVGKHSQWAEGPVVIPGWRYAEGMYAHQLDYWTFDNPNAFYPRPTDQAQSSIRNFLPQTKYLLNRSYVRCKNLTFGYSLPKEMLSKIVGIQNIRVFFSGENLFEKSNMKIPVDPETSYSVAGANDVSTYGRIYPFMRTYAFGMQIVF